MTANYIAPADLRVDNKIKHGDKRLPDESFSADMCNSTFMWFWKFLIFKVRPSKKLQSDINDELHFPKQGISESCNVNQKRFEEIFQHEVAVKGHINVSMLYVVWQFCKVAFITASLTRLLSIIIAITAPLLLLFDLYDPDLERYEFNVTFREEKYRYSFIAYFVCIFGMYYLKSASDWLSLRIAIRLRTACLASAYKRGLESSVANMVSIHQILNLTAGDNEIIVQFIRKGSILLSHTIGLCLCMGTSILLVRAEGLWNLLSILSILLISLFLILISMKHSNQSWFYLDKKLIIVDDCCRSFCNGRILSRFADFTKRFSSALSSQYQALARAEVLRSNFSADVILVIIGEFMVLFVDDTSRYMVLVLLNATITIVLMFEWSDALSAVLQGRLPLEKIKIAMTSVPTSVTNEDYERLRSSPIVDPESAIYISEATFQWPSSKEFKLHIKKLRIPKGQVFGLTGGPASGKSSLICALLGHIPIESGVIKRNGNIAYFPETPYLENDESVLNNIIFNQQFDNEKYENALEMVQLGKKGIGSDPICEDVPVGQLVLTPKQIQKISLARSIYCDREIIILENPLCDFKGDITHNFDEIFPKICAKLIEMGKTVILASQNDNILRHCHSISFLIDGKTMGQYNYKELLNDETYQTSLRYHLADATITHSNEETVMVNVNDLTATLIESNKTKQLVRRNVGDYCMIFGNVIMQFFTSVYCVFLVNTLIFRHVGQQSFELLCLIWLTVFQILTSSYMFKAPSNLNKRIQRTMFNNLLNASLDRTNETVLNRILSLFMDSHIAVHQIRLISTRFWGDAFAMGLISITILSSVQGFVIMFAGLLFYFIAYYICRETVSYYAKLERQTRENVLRNFTNQYNGRAVIQSFELIGESQNRVFSLIEENSTAVLMRMSTLFFAQFMCHCLQVIMLGCLVTVDLNLNKYRSASNQASLLLVLMYLFSRLTSTFDKLLETYLDALVMDQKIANVNAFLEKTQTTTDVLNGA